MRTPLRLCDSEDCDEDGRPVDVFEELVCAASRDLHHITITQILRPIVESLDAVSVCLSN